MKTNTLTCSSAIIYFFSGTGNSLRVAKKIASLISIPCHSLVNIRYKKYFNAADQTISRITGFVFPVHGFTAPWAVMRFAASMPRGNGSQAFVVITRGGSRPFWIFFLPGLGGSASYIVALILMLKGYRIQGITGVDMPSNWMSLHWGLHRKNQDYIFNRSEKKIRAFSSRIASGKRYLFTLNNCSEFIAGCALAPVSFLYLIIGRFGLAKMFYANTRCTGCGLCARECPVSAIIMKGSIHPRPYWTFSCESCMHCMGYCPEKAVESSHPLGAAFYFLFSASGSALLMLTVKKMFPGISGQLHPALSLVLDYCFFMAAYFIIYRIFFLMIRIPPVNRLLTGATLTHYYRRYHEPETAIADYHRQ